MPLSIKNDATERLARQVASATGESLTEAIHKALEQRWQHLKAKHRGKILASQLEDLLQRVDALPALDPRTEDEILGYDEHGISR
jgi:antitoxin VapB